MGAQGSQGPPGDRVRNYTVLLHLLNVCPSFPVCPLQLDSVIPSSLSLLPPQGAMGPDGDHGNPGLKGARVRTWIQFIRRSRIITLYPLYRRKVLTNPAFKSQTGCCSAIPETDSLSQCFPSQSLGHTGQIQFFVLSQSLEHLTQAIKRFKYLTGVLRTGIKQNCGSVQYTLSIGLGNTALTSRTIQSLL